MFDFLKKKNKQEIYAPIKGKCISIENVSDKVFSSKMMGDGIAFEPMTNQVFAPCDAIVSMIASSKHAIGLINSDGLEILIHVGLDTVNYMGKGFIVNVKKQQKVKKGELLMTFDKDFFEKENVCLTIPMVITNSKEYHLELFNINENVCDEDIVIRYKKA